MLQVVVVVVVVVGVVAVSLGLVVLSFGLVVDVAIGLVECVMMEIFL